MGRVALAVLPPPFSFALPFTVSTVLLISTMPRPKSRSDLFTAKISCWRHPVSNAKVTNAVHLASSRTAASNLFMSARLNGFTFDSDRFGGFESPLGLATFRSSRSSFTAAFSARAKSRNALRRVLSLAPSKAELSHALTSALLKSLSLIAPSTSSAMTYFAKRFPSLARVVSAQYGLAPSHQFSRYADNGGFFGSTREGFQAFSRWETSRWVSAVNVRETPWIRMRPRHLPSGSCSR